LKRGATSTKHRQLRFSIAPAPAATIESCARTNRQKFSPGARLDIFSSKRTELIGGQKKRSPKRARWEGTMNQTTGAVYQPELIELMRSVLDEAMLTLSESKRTSAMRAEIASNILACAAKGERNPKVLTMAALSAVVDCTHYSHDISPERRAV
jgi:hypothetical protein